MPAGASTILTLTTGTAYHNDLSSMSGLLNLYAARYPFSPSYTTGGESITGPSGKTTLWLWASAPGYIVSHTGTKLKVFRSGAAGGSLEEVTAGTNLSGVTADLIGVTHG